MSKKAIKAYKDATEELAKAFVKKYFKDYIYNKDTYWVADDVGGVFCVGDSYFFGVDRMLEALEFNASYKKLVDYYDREVELASDDKRMDISFTNYVKYGWIK